MKRHVTTVVWCLELLTPRTHQLNAVLCQLSEQLQITKASIAHI